MDCDDVREALSALLDEEDPGVDPADLDGHLARCHACRVWRERAHELTRRVRLQPAKPEPRPPRALLEAVLAERRAGWRSWSPAALPRAGLVVVAVVQLAVAVPALVLGRDHSAPVHLARELGSFDAALAVGFLVAAWRPDRASGLAPLAATAAALLTVTAVVDLVAGRTSLVDEAPHLLVVAGLLLLLRLSRVLPEGWPTRSSSTAARVPASTGVVGTRVVGACGGARDAGSGPAQEAGGVQPRAEPVPARPATLDTGRAVHGAC